MLRRHAATALAAARRRGAIVPAGSIGSNWLSSAESLTDTFTRGSGPLLVAVDLRHFGPAIHRRGDAFDQVADTLASIARPRLAGDRFAEDVEREGPLLPRAREGRRPALRSVSVPAMNRRACDIALRRAAIAAASPPSRVRVATSSPSRAAAGRRSRTSSKYSCRCRAIASFVASIGSTSMKRNICTLTDSSAIAQAMIRSSHQRRSQMPGPARIETLKQRAADPLRGLFDLVEFRGREVVHEVFWGLHAIF